MVLLVLAAYGLLVDHTPQELSMNHAASPPAGPRNDEDQPASPSFAPAAHLDATGLSCSTLTPTIRAAILELDFGAVLEIVTDDPEAEEGLRSWTRLTGNELVAAEAGPGSARRFGIRRSPRLPAATTTTTKTTGKGTI